MNEWANSGRDATRALFVGNPRRKKNRGSRPRVFSPVDSHASELTSQLLDDGVWDDDDVVDMIVGLAYSDAVDMMVWMLSVTRKFCN